MVAHTVVQNAYIFIYPDTYRMGYLRQVPEDTPQTPLGKAETAARKAIVRPETKSPEPANESPFYI